MRQTRLHLLVAAIVAMGPLAVAHANYRNPAAPPTTSAVDPLRDDVNFISIASTGYFQRLAAMPRTGADEQAMQRSPLALADERLNEDVSFVSLGTDGYFQQLAAMSPTAIQGYVPGAGRFDPQATAAREADERLWDRMYPIGGEGTS